MKIQTEQTIRVSTESKKCFVTLKEFCQMMWRGEFPLVRRKQFGGRANVGNVRGKLKWSRIVTQKNSSNHWEIDLVSANHLEAEYLKEEQIRTEIEETPEVAMLRMLAEEQSRFLQETRDKLEQLRTDQFNARMSA